MFTRAYIYACVYACKIVRFYTHTCFLLWSTLSGCHLSAIALYAFLIVFCMYVCMNVCVHVCMHVCVHVCLRHICLSDRVCMYVCMYVCVHVFMCHICLPHRFPHSRIHVSMHACMYLSVIDLYAFLIVFCTYLRIGVCVHTLCCVFMYD